MIADDNFERDRRRAIVTEAHRWIGTPYMHQASLLGAGCDCLGLIRGVWREVIGHEPQAAGPYQPDWAEAGGADNLYNAAQKYFRLIENNEWDAGDVLLFRWRANCVAKHLAIVSSRSHMIHAHDGASVCEVSIGPFWRKRIAGVFAFPDRPPQQ